MPLQRVVRSRVLTPGQTRRFEALRSAARLLDSAIRVPGTKRSIGLDPIMGLVPVFGDLISPLFAAAVIWQARDLGIPRVVQLRMVLNVAIDAIVGAVPLLGDLFDFAWKANTRNLTLLEQHASDDRRPTSGDWLFVALMFGLLLAVGVAPFVFVGWLVNVVTGP
jgi:hypothetical protein